MTDIKTKNIDKLNIYDINSLYYGINTEDEILMFKKISKENKRLEDDI